MLRLNKINLPSFKLAITKGIWNWPVCCRRHGFDSHFSLIFSPDFLFRCCLNWVQINWGTNSASVISLNCVIFFSLTHPRISTIPSNSATSFLLVLITSYKLLEWLLCWMIAPIFKFIKNCLNFICFAGQFEVGKHFMARVLCLIMLPIVVYLFWFAVHFRMLPNRYRLIILKFEFEIEKLIFLL